MVLVFMEEDENMSNLSEKTSKNFRLFYFDEESAKDFEVWLYQNESLENEIGKEAFLNIVSFDFSQKNKENHHQLKGIIKDIYNSQQADAIIMDQAKAIAMSILDQSCPIDVGCRKLANISENEHTFVNRVFVAYSDEFDRLGSTNFYDNRIKDDVKKLLLHIESIRVK